MDFFSLPHLLLILVIVVVLFGAGKMPRVMGDFAKGIKAFKAGLKEEEASGSPPSAENPAPAQRVESSAADRPHEHV
jgi:sec-independent protein translocase protein TatA